MTLEQIENMSTDELLKFIQSEIDKLQNEKNNQ
jgi:hypothetical protein